MNREELLAILKNAAEPALAKKPEERSYEERYAIWEYERFLNKDFEYDEGEEVEIYDGEELANNKIKDGFGKDFPEWFRNIGTLFGRKVKMNDNKIYTLVGVAYTYLDYYYIVENSNHNKEMWSCVGGIKIVS